ncbi:membrane protein FxsA [Pseudomonas laurentiana]|uniref:Membrane protein FxsA n=1 Tax=Pseudomonas laurentiana TaxID=2364649 RepID=A0A6I5RWK1_9PSED|nr:FxsA family protein [Pseudomonas laurentiana]NES12020.1 membrane protein FxsA [Pseudomonas laurentiana]GGU71316.1 membrane protein FxsA [Pseudomonas laurentiana]
MRAFLLLFLLFPVLELYVFFKVSTAIGFFPALLLIIASSALGVLVMRVAGLATALRARESLQRGELPAEQMFQGLLLAVGGVLLLVPGFITDVVGLICLLPVTRRLIGRRLRERAEAQAMRQRAFSDDPFAGRPGAQGNAPRQPNVIEGEYEHRDS